MANADSDSEDDFMSDKFLLDLPSSSSSKSKPKPKPNAITSTSTSTSGSGSGLGVNAGSSAGSGERTEELTYSARRNAESLRNLRRGQASNKIPLKVLEEQRRREGLNTSLFDLPNTHASSSSGLSSGFGSGPGLGSGLGAGPSSSGSGSGGGSTNKAMDLMMKMGWKVGEGLGKKRSPSPPPTAPPSDSKRAKLSSTTDKGAHETEADEEAEAEAEEGSRRGLGSRSHPNSGAGSTSQPKHAPRTEPIRITLWSGRKGLGHASNPSSSANGRDTSPPFPSKFNENISGRNPDALDPRKMERLGKETDGFRERQRAEYALKEAERKGRAGRERLKELDLANGVKFHPLHVLPSDPLGSIPRPLLKLVYPAHPFSPSPSPPLSSGPGSRARAAAEPIQAYGADENLSAAEKIRAMMRRDMLSSVAGVGGGGGDDDDDDDEDEGVVRFGITDDSNSDLDDSTRGANNAASSAEGQYDGVVWDEMVAGTKRVLTMGPETYLSFVVDQLRHEHLFCFWCAFKYGSYEEMEGQGGCPGENEDDH